MQNVILLGTCFGLTIMTKMSALILGPGIAGLLVYRFVKDKKSRGSKMLQYAGIGVCAGVLGLWYPIKNYLL